MEKTFSITQAKGYLSIILSGSYDASEVIAFEKMLFPLLNANPQDVVVSCQQLQSISKDWERMLVNVQVFLKKNSKQLALVQVSSKLMSFFRAEGLDSSFKFYPSAKEALSDLGLTKRMSLDTEFINPFLVATLHVLEVQANVKATQGKFYLKDSKNKLHELPRDISGVIGIVSEAFNGSVVISFPEATFLKIISSMLGETYTELTKDILDGASEITNMIFGQAKVALNEKGYGIQTALPSVISGKGHILDAITKGPIIVVPFSSELGNFFIEICLS